MLQCIFTIFMRCFGARLRSGKIVADDGILTDPLLFRSRKSNGGENTLNEEGKIDDHTLYYYAN